MSIQPSSVSDHSKGSCGSRVLGLNVTYEPIQMEAVEQYFHLVLEQILSWNVPWSNIICLIL